MTQLRVTEYRKGLAEDPCHVLFLDAVGSDPLLAMNLKKCAIEFGCSPATFWRYAKGRSRWPAAIWIKTMAYLEEQGRPVDWNRILGALGGTGSEAA